VTFDVNQHIRQLLTITLLMVELWSCGKAVVM